MNGSFGWYSLIPIALVILAVYVAAGTSSRPLKAVLFGFAIILTAVMIWNVAVIVRRSGR